MPNKDRDKDESINDPFEQQLKGPCIQSPEEILLDELKAFDAGEFAQSFSGEKCEHLSFAEMDAELGSGHPEWGDCA
ncbi:hypothetical protein [Solemya velum gill symbiont]|uniref:Uncharacterized protein n=1 Tax=Solemya velum gill symbiont TaxID=2340 RepID=A0A0B0H5W1_SOVGS|nr:hypothetical protein [Solemya velum gill symbiont]KHF24490.1 hypothetical protein JV46_28650 [Solemya velum gill symbiont]OOY51695.1 hypothetical protein BOV97_07800 [Solemya velum gill symbiont]OOY55625.1 hypothetical protein BOV99_07345 [Solemya velum gill symbiont]OOY57028.1 hypothetical protein BOW00_06600 [Solemya velum gill symbiont]OOY60042.1 hypothetical protein BOW02_07150 [Solemya velum gill symbiont]